MSGNQIILNNKNLLVLTPNGWSKFKGIKKVEPQKNVEQLEFTFSDNSKIIVSITHRFKLKKSIKSIGEFIYASELWYIFSKKQKNLKTKYALQNINNKKIYVVNVEKVKNKVILYDLIDVEKNNEYYTNNIVSHNCAHIEKFDFHWVGLYSTLTHGGKCILLSTPAGVGNQFHKLWMEAKNNENDFNPIELPWQVHPEHDEEWFNTQCRNLDKRGIAQELLCSFNSSGKTYIDVEQIQWLAGQVRPAIGKFDEDPNVWIWKKPIPGRKYIISADVAKGNGNDYSTFYVIDTEEIEAVAEYQGKRPPDSLAELLVSVGKIYNTALICNEANSFGLVTSIKLRDMKYPRLYYEKFAKTGNVLFKEYTEMDVDGETPGFTTSSKNRTQILAKLEEVLRNKRLKIYSSRFAEEVKTLIWTGIRAQAQKNYNDDLSMALAIACWIFDMGDNVVTDQTELNNAMLMAMSKTSNTFTSNNYNQVTNRINDNSPVSPMSFMRSNSNVSKMNNNNSNNKIPPGVNKEQFQQAMETYNMYHWLLGK